MCPLLSIVARVNLKSEYSARMQTSHKVRSTARIWKLPVQVNAHVLNELARVQRTITTTNFLLLHVQEVFKAVEQLEFEDRCGPECVSCLTPDLLVDEK